MIKVVIIIDTLLWLLLAFIGVSFSYIIYYLIDYKSSKKFKLKVEDTPEEKQFKTSFLMKTETMYKKINPNMDFKRYLTQLSIIALSVFIVGLYFYLKLGQALILPVALLVSIFVYFVAYDNLKKQYQRNRFIFKNELNEYLYHFAIALKLNSPYVATMESAEYASENLKPYVDELITQISLYPNTSKPYRDFAKQLGFVEAQRFVNTVEQLMHVNSETAEELIDAQLEVSKELQNEMYNELLEVRPNKVNAYAELMIVPFLVIVFTMIVVLILETTGQLF